jgi:uncharacterized protein (DUF885 family)
MMHGLERRGFLAGGGAMAGTWLAGMPGLAFAQDTGDAAFVSLLDRIFWSSLLIEPERATGLGSTPACAPLRHRLDGAGRARARPAWRSIVMPAPPYPHSIRRAERGEQAQSRHRAASPRRGNGGAPFDIHDPQTPFTVDQQRGAYFSIPDFLDNQHPIATLDDAEAYLDRLAAFAMVLDDETAEVARQAGKGRIPRPGRSIWRWARWASCAAWPRRRAAWSLRWCAAPRKRAWPETGSARATAIVQDKVYPALDRQIALHRRLRAKSPAGDGIWRLKQGADIYAAALGAATTTTLTPEQVHQMGLDQVADITAQLDSVLKAAGHTTGSVGQRLSALNRSADQLYPDTAQGRTDLIAGLNKSVAAMREKLPRAFADIPNDPLVIRAVPTDIQDGAPNGYYNSAPLDGSRPAIYWINLKSVSDWPKYTLPSLTYHEGIPGHHLQGGYARAVANCRGFCATTSFPPYGEGWALYAEQLGDELGGYDGIERAGYLQSFLFRAVRLVVDTGIHHYRWSREKATAYMVEKTGFTQARSQREIERYCTMIGQACSHKIGHTAGGQSQEGAGRAGRQVQPALVPRRAQGRAMPSRCWKRASTNALPSACAARDGQSGPEAAVCATPACRSGILVDDLAAARAAGLALAAHDISILVLALAQVLQEGLERGQLAVVGIAIAVAALAAARGGAVGVTGVVDRRLRIDVVGNSVAVGVGRRVGAAAAGPTGATAAARAAGCGQCPWRHLPRWCHPGCCRPGRPVRPRRTLSTRRSGRSSACRP